MEEVMKILPPKIAECLKKTGITDATEIRLRAHKRLCVKQKDKEELLEYTVLSTDILEVLKRVSSNSIYSIQNSINEGFVTAPGGNRIGITGEVVYENGVIKNIKNISSMNIRISHEVVGCSDCVIDKMFDGGELKNTLIVSAPGKGKTTMLRDIIRNLSIRGKNICVVDERYEIANVYYGKASLDIGEKTDVMSGVSKAEGINFMVRSMGPDVIATDEIGGENDCLAVKSACLSGVKVVATAHGSKDEPLPYNLQQLVNEGVFKLVIYLSCDIGKIEKIVNM